MPVLIDLFMTFAKIGLFIFGGGYAMLSLIEDICVEKKKWISHDELMNITVIAESTPGPIAINCATYVGYKKGKMAGGIMATIGVVMPSFVIIFLISKYLERFLEIRWIANAFCGIKLAVGILIIDAAVKMVIKMKKKPLQICIMVVSFLFVMIINVMKIRFSTILIMLSSALISIFVFVIEQKTKKEGER
ncbi:MAG: chromate transporter [Lachnospiraceae bacterium]|nr:chromate transporter [Lachnospiraceae bacterium]